MQKESLSMTSAPNRAYHEGRTGIWVPLNLRDQDCQEFSLTAGALGEFADLEFVGPGHAVLKGLPGGSRRLVA